MHYLAGNILDRKIKSENIAFTYTGDYFFEANLPIFLKFGVYRTLKKTLWREFWST